jgi:hypothetical protein
LNKKGLPFFYEIFLDWENAGNPDSSGSSFWEHYRDPLAPERKNMPQTPSNDPARVYDYLNEYRASKYGERLTCDGPAILTYKSLPVLRSYGLTHVVPTRENELRDVPIKAIGVWETVGKRSSCTHSREILTSIGALGIPVNPWFQKHLGLPGFLHEYKWLDTKLSDNVENAFQALALDEHRAPFSPAVWEKPEGSQTVSQYRYAVESLLTVLQYLKQTWFPGAHSNIGGSYDDTATADISLAWMMDQLSGDSRDAPLDKKDWIEFYDDYLDTQQALNKVWYQSNPPVRGWSLGAIYNSFTFPQSLAGRMVRTPGRYRVTNPLTGTQKHGGVLMRDTHETIHASVRARIDLGGSASEQKSSKWSHLVQWLRKLLGRDGKILYEPEALGWWRLHDGHQHHNEFSINSKLTFRGAEGSTRTPWWEWIGNDKLVPRGQVLSEDVLGKFELQLLGHYKEVADEIEASNKGLASVDELKRVRERVARRSVTV